MATLEQRIAALEQAQQTRIERNPQLDADIRTAYGYFKANGEREALAMVIYLESTV